MVAIINVAASIHRIFNYNENKIEQGVAKIIGAQNYPLDPAEMTKNMRLNFLVNRMALNENVKRNSVHISLNFDPSESNFSADKLMSIADTYMKKLGFGDQPFLVYQHHDAGHPHLHLVTTNIKQDGTRIDMHHLAIRKSEPARKEIEKEFDLVVAEGRKEKAIYKVQPIATGIVEYGKMESKKAISNVLRTVIEGYRYTSLPELNAVLRQYNVMADRGSENSRIYKGGGLVYRIIDQTGNPVGVPIKASDFYSKPTLKLLEDKFTRNDLSRTPHKARIKNIIDKAILNMKPTLLELIGLLEKQGIHMAMRKSDTDQIYGITYVDHTTRCVFNGSTLGKQYSAKGILDRCTENAVHRQNLTAYSAYAPLGLQSQAVPPTTEIKDADHVPQKSSVTEGLSNVLGEILQPEQVSDYVPYELTAKRKKRKKKRK